MTSEEVKNIVAQFLETLDKQGLIKFNPEFWNNKFTKNFAVRTPIFASAINKIIETYEKKRQDFNMTDDEMSIFIYSSMVNFITLNLEFIKKILTVLMDHEKIKISKKITYGGLLIQIFNYLKYDESQGKVIWDYFFVDFRNAISHIMYIITKNGVSIEKDGQSIHYNNDELNNLALNVRGIMDVFSEFGIKKTKELELLALEQEKKADELNKQVEQLRQENEERKRKTESVKRQTVRLNRKAKKLERKSEILDRKMKKKKKTVRVIPKSKK